MPWSNDNLLWTTMKGQIEGFRRPSQRKLSRLQNIQQWIGTPVVIYLLRVRLRGVSTAYYLNE